MFKDYTIYRIKAATKFQMRVKQVENDKFTENKYMLFMVSALPTGEVKNGKGTFAWSPKDHKNKQCTILMGDNDIADFLAVLTGQKQNVGLLNPKTGKYSTFHKHEAGNAVISLERVKKDNGDTFFNLNVSAQQNGETCRVSHDISITEAQILVTLLRRFIETKYGW